MAAQQAQAQNASLYVGDLPADITEAMLFDVFKAVGPVLSIRVCRDAVTRRSLGYAYVNFQNPTDAERALETLNYQPVGGRPIRIMWCHRDPGLRKSGQGNVFIKNLDPEIDNQSLYDTFSQFGNILSCKVALENGESRGYGFVHFETDASADAAIEKVNGMLLSGRKVFVGKFMRRQQRLQLSAADFTNCYVKNLKANISSDDLRTFLETKFGKLASVVVKEDKKSRKFAFVDFENHEDASAAVEELHDKENEEIGAEGVNVYIQRAQKKSERQDELRKKFAQMKAKRINDYSGHNLYVKNLDDTVTDQDLREAFAKFGEITSTKVMLDEKDPPQSKGFGFVCFKELEAANSALQQMNGHVLGSKPLYVNVAQRREVRRATLEIQYAARLGRGVAGGGGPGGAPFPPGAMPGYQGGPYGGFPQGGMPPYMAGARGMPGQKGWPQGGVPFGAPAMGGPAGMRPQPQRRPMGAGPPRGPGAPGAPPHPGQFPGGPRGGPMPGRPGVPPMMAGPGALPGGQNFAYTKQARNREQVPGMPGAAPPMPAPQQPIPGGMEPLTPAALASMSPEQQKNTLGERLFARITETHPDHAAKITGMLLEMDITEQLNLLESPETLGSKISEALEVLNIHGQDS